MSFPHTPKQNRFLAALPEEVYERLKPCLELVPLPEGWAVYKNGGETDLVYFPTTGIISLLSTTDDGESAKIAVIGNEGLFGIAMLMGRKITAVVQGDGYAYRLKAANLRREFELGSPLCYLLQRYTQGLSARIAQNTMCNRPPVVGAGIATIGASRSSINSAGAQVSPRPRSFALTRSRANLPSRGRVS